VEPVSVPALESDGLVDPVATVVDPELVEEPPPFESPQPKAVGMAAMMVNEAKRSGLMR
jgi:hypothetical protein